MWVAITRSAMRCSSLSGGHWSEGIAAGWAHAPAGVSATPPQRAVRSVRRSREWRSCSMTTSSERVVHPDADGPLRVARERRAVAAGAGEAQAPDADRELLVKDVATVDRVADL